MFLLLTWVPSLVGVTADRACAMPTLARLPFASPLAPIAAPPSPLMLIEHRHCRRVFHELCAASDRPRPLTQPNQKIPGTKRSASVVASCHDLGLPAASRDARFDRTDALRWLRHARTLGPPLDGHVARCSKLRLSVRRRDNHDIAVQIADPELSVPRVGITVHIEHDR